MYMNGKVAQGIRRIVGYLFFVLPIVFAGPLWAANGNGSKIVLPIEEDGIVKLVATLQDNPAFTGVEWKLYRLEQPAYPVRVIRRHTAMINLQPGDYRAVVKLKSISRSRSFKIKSRIVKEVIISMD